MNSPSPIGTITVIVSDGVAAVRIDNPGRRNAVTRSMCLELQELMPRLDADPDVIAVTVQGTGRDFSAGAAIDELPDVLLDRQDDGSVIDQLSRADQAISSLAKPSIALVDGPCIGGGWQIASACDFIVASELSVFAITPAKLGVIYPRPGIERLLRLVGPANAKFILFGGETFSASRAQALGLVTAVVADDEYAAYCHALLEAILQRSRFTIHWMKRLIDRTTAAAPGLADDWDEAWAAMTAGPDMEIGRRAFLDRRSPRFTWTPAGPGEEPSI